ncbi:MAG: hypothetical protein ACXABL_01165 [Candidatus Thorarchaeota archaeon]|jgi:hypothetical protein
MNLAALLLADQSPALRLLVLRHLLDRKKDDPEVQELEGFLNEDPIINDLLMRQGKDGSWKDSDIGGTITGDKVRATSFALYRMSYMGLPNDNPAVQRGVEYIFSKQKKNGSWPVLRSYDGVSIDGGVYTMIPLQTSIPLLGVAASGYSTDNRAKNAYDWLLETRLEDGTWPTGMIGEVFGYQAGYRKMPHSEWGCRTNTTLALSCLALHPERRQGQEARRALDLLLARETRDRVNLGFNVARTVGFEQHRGHFTFHAKFDPGLILDLSWRIGASIEDERVADLVDWIIGQQGQYGMWEYEPQPEASRWITYDILRSLSRLDSSTDWFTSEIRTRYRSYKKRVKRF